MKPLNLLAVFTRPSVFAAAMSVAVAFAFVSSASAGEKKFDALGGVTAEALTPAAMDAIQGTGLLAIFNKEFPFDPKISINDAIAFIKVGTGASFHMIIDLNESGKNKVHRFSF